MNKFRVGDPVDHCFVVIHASEKLTRGGKIYLSMDVRNKFIACNTKIWDWEKVRVNLDQEPAAGSYVKLVGTVDEYAGATQIKTESIVVVDEQDVDMGHIVETADKSLQELENELRHYLDMIDHPVIKHICHSVLDSEGLYDLFISKPAATKNHHAVQHGLLEHTVSMMGAAVKLQSHYDFLSLDLLLAGCLLHDLGKTIEINSVVKGSYSTEGRLLGHMSIAVSLIEQATSFEDSEEVKLLKHMVLSHHGKMEYGSPMQPSIPEALALHFIDNMDAQFYTLFRQTKDLNQGEWTPNRVSINSQYSYYYKHSLSPAKDYYRK